MASIIDLTKQARRALLQAQSYFENYRGETEYARRPWIGQRLYGREISLISEAVPARIRADEREQFVESCLGIAPLVVSALRDASAKMNWLSTQKGLVDLSNKIAELADLPIAPYRPNHRDAYVATTNPDELITSVIARAAGAPVIIAPLYDEPGGP